MVTTGPPILVYTGREGKLLNSFYSLAARFNAWLAPGDPYGGETYRVRGRRRLPP